MNNAAMDWTALWVSCKLALATTAILLLAAPPLAALLAFCRFRGKDFLEATCNLPLVLPPTVLGFFLLMAMSPAAWPGRAWEAVFGSTLAFTFPGLVLASVIFNLPFALQPLRVAFAKLDRRLLESANVLGCARVSAFMRVILPNSIGGLITAAAMVFAHTLGEFGVALMVGGSIKGETRVASVAIFESVEMMDYGGAALMSLALLPPAYAMLLLMRRMEDKS